MKVIKVMKKILFNFNYKILMNNNLKVFNVVLMFKIIKVNIKMFIINLRYLIKKINLVNSLNKQVILNLIKQKDINLLVQFILKMNKI